MTTRLTGSLNQGYKPNYKPAPQDAGFHFVQALLLLTHHLPLKDAFVLLTIIPDTMKKGSSTNSVGGSNLTPN